MRIAIIGTGLIGGSIGLAIKAGNPDSTVVAFDADPDAARLAVARGAADIAAGSLSAAVADSDVVFIATPVSLVASLAAEAAKAAPAGAIVTDVGSTKSRVVLEVERSLPEGVHFIGGHPMAGTEDQGIEAARADLFAGAWWILTPTDRSDPEAYRRLLGLLTTLGARALAISPAAHDELLAVISHVPQLTATALMNMASERGREHGSVLALAAGGFRDVTRVAASNPEIWLDICAENADAIARALEAFAARLLALRDLVAAGDRRGLGEALLAAREARRNLPGKGVAGDLYEVRMPVPDRPGVLAEVTTTIGNLGINIEDLHISHSAEGGRGVLHLSVEGADAADRVADTLTALGFDAKAIRL